MPHTARNQQLMKVVLCGLIAALSYVVFTFLQIKIPLPGGDQTSLHLGNAVCVMGALLLGGPLGGLGGALGMTIGDLFDPIYIISAPKTFILKFCIGLIAGAVAHKWGKITQTDDARHVFRFTLLAALLALLFNIVFDPVISYFYDRLILGKVAEFAFFQKLLSTSINAVASIAASTALYTMLRPAMKKAHLLPKIK